MTDTNPQYIDQAYARLKAEGGLVDLGEAGRLRLRGEDRLRFLGGLVTCETTSLEAGEGTYGFFTDIKGRLLADVVILATEDSLWLEVPAGTASTIEAHLTKYRIADRVEIDRIESPYWLSLIGRGALGATDLPTDDWSHGTIAIGGESVTAFRDRRLGVPAVTLLVDGETRGRIHETRSQPATDAGLDRAALEILRIEAGRPRFGIDMSSDNFPQETGLADETVSYTKGCYLGQEIVARIHYRGAVNRRLVGVRFVADGLSRTEDLSGRDLTLDGRGVGTVTSFAWSPDHGPIGLAICHKRAVEGQAVDSEPEGRSAATVTPLPFGI